MNKLLVQIFDRSVEMLKQDKRCLGGWHFGSMSRNQQDEYSDVDPVFLIADKDFDAFNEDIHQLFYKLSKDCILIWPEEFNSNDLRNYAVLMKGTDGCIVQYDFTIMNNSKIMNPFCKIWYKQCTDNNIIFDRYGDISRLLKTNIDEDSTSRQIDVLHQINKYWLFCYIAIKYFKREDIFKLQSTMQELFHIHSNLLLSIYQKESWGGWPSLIKNNVPSEKQIFLLKYFCESDIFNIRENLFHVMEAFSKDINYICRNRSLEYDSYLEQSVKDYVCKNMNN